MESLYNISNELNNIFFEIEENGGEVTDEILNRLAISEDNLKQKLDNYRKAYTSLTFDAETCKKEEIRIANIRKTHEANANRLKNAMFVAVKQFGETGKNGNKQINLIDSKLYTKTSKSVDYDTVLVAILKDCIVSWLRGLDNNDMLDNVSFTVDEILDNINEEFIHLYTEQAKELFDKTGHYFTINDLNLLNLKFEFNLTIGELLTYNGLNIAKAYFGEEHNANISLNVNKPSIKALLDTGEFDNNIAKMSQNETLVIK